MAATSQRRLRDICWSRSDHKPRSLFVEIATTISCLSTAVSEWVVLQRKFKCDRQHSSLTPDEELNCVMYYSSFCIINIVHFLAHSVFVLFLLAIWSVTVCHRIHHYLTWCCWHIFCIFVDNTLFCYYHYGGISVHWFCSKLACILCIFMYARLFICHVMAMFLKLSVFNHWMYNMCSSLDCFCLSLSVLWHCCCILFTSLLVTAIWLALKSYLLKTE